jgi:hypothetical protein
MKYRMTIAKMKPHVLRANGLNPRISAPGGYGSINTSNPPDG